MFKIDYGKTEKTRYDQSKFMPFVEGMYDILDSQFMHELKKSNQYGIFTVTVEDGQPSLIAEKIYGYGYHQYWWILMYYNDIIDPKDIVTGMTLRYPNVASLERVYFGLASGSTIS